VLIAAAGGWLILDGACLGAPFSQHQPAASTSRQLQACS